MTTLEDVREAASCAEDVRVRLGLKRALRDYKVSWCYREGNATLAELARATGLSKQRVHQIVGEE